MNDFTEESRFSPKHFMSRASDLLQKIKEDIDAHRAETALQKIRRDVITMDTDNDIGRVATARRNSLPPERGKKSGCPVLNALGVGSREKTAIRTQSKAFGGSLFKCGTDGRSPSSMSEGGVLYRYESKPTGLKWE
ncbi:hypothetical protein MRX96_009227 [Rhipicephalus microplus]